MTITLTEFMQVVYVVAAFIAGAWALIKITGAQFQRAIYVRFDAMTERFEEMEKIRDERNKLSDERFERIEEGQSKAARELLEFKLDVSEHRVHSDDFVRNQTLIEAKIDGLAKSIENFFLRMHINK